MLDPSFVPKMRVSLPRFISFFECTSDMISGVGIDVRCEGAFLAILVFFIFLCFLENHTSFFHFLLSELILAG